MKVHLLDNGYVWAPKRKDFPGGPKEDISGNQGFRARKASHPCYYASRGRDSSYLGLLYRFGPRKRGFSF